MSCRALTLAALLAACGNEPEIVPACPVVQMAVASDHSLWSPTLGDPETRPFYATFVGPALAELDGTVEWRFRKFGFSTPFALGTYDLGHPCEDLWTCPVTILVSPSSGKRFSAVAGTATITKDPFAARLQVQLAGVSLAAVDESGARVPDGACAAFADGVVDTVAHYECPITTYEANDGCHCGCGNFDPDCAIPGAPVIGCTTGAACDGASCECSTVPCLEGVCIPGPLYLHPLDWCSTDAGIIDDARIGESCAPSSRDRRVCDVTDGVPAGLCDDLIELDGRCRAMCRADADCAPPEHCVPRIVGEGDFGICYPVPPNDTCEGAALLTLDTPLETHNRGAVKQYANSCGALGAPRGADVAFAVDLTAGRPATIDLPGRAADLLLQVYPDAASCRVDSACLASNHALPIATRLPMAFTPTTTGRYLIVVSAASPYTWSASLAFTIVVRQP